MRRIGFIIFVAGVVVSSWYAARVVPEDELHGSGERGRVTAMDRVAGWAGVAGMPFGLGAVLMIAGGVLARRTAGSGSVPDEGAIDAGAALAQIAARVAALDRFDPEADAAPLHEALDRLLEDEIPAFLEGREHHIETLGLARYARVMSAFAAGERSLARAWSALTDEVVAEVGPCLVAAKTSMASAAELAVP